MRFLLWLALFAFIYAPFFYIGSVLVKAPQVITAVLALVGLPLLASWYFRNRQLRVFLNLKFIGLCVVALLFLAHGAQDAMALQMYLLGFAVLAAACCYVSVYRRVYGPSAPRIMLMHLFYVGVVHGLIMLSSFVSPTVMEFLQAHFYHSEKALISWQVRVPGVLFEGFSILSVAQAMTAVCGMSVLLSENRSLPTRGRLAILSGLLVILISLMLSGRLGLVVFFACLLFLLGLNARLLMSKRFLAAAVSIGVVSVTLLGAMMLYGRESETFGSNVGLALELVYNFLEYGDLHSRSTDALLESQYFLPDGLWNLLFGVGNFGRGDGYIESDVGYVIFIFGGGLVGLVAATAFYVCAALQAYGARKVMPTTSQVVLAFVFLTFLVNFKDIIFFHLVGFSAIFYLCYLSLIEGHRGVAPSASPSALRIASA